MGLHEPTYPNPPIGHDDGIWDRLRRLHRSPRRKRLSFGIFDFSSTGCLLLPLSSCSMALRRVVSKDLPETDVLLSTPAGSVTMKKDVWEIHLVLDRQQWSNTRHVDNAYIKTRCAACGSYSRSGRAYRGKRRGSLSRTWQAQPISGP